METPTTPVTAIDKSGKDHTFLMDFGAKRRIMRRLRALQLRGELDADLSKTEMIDNIELSYLTVWEARQTKAKVSEDEYLAQFKEMDLVRASNEIWSRYNAANPPEPEPETASSQPSETTMSSASASGVDG